ncbi:MAG: ABC transporter ATP-binding protein [Rhodospirillales bacterium]|nr:ABC transporter ATP-binding protein [Rhodospirillales bacterium]MDE0380884.1 ABC transporter ATP-binding protein [Rhodospirillales bacterium]
MLRVERLSRSFGGVAALEALDLAVAEGEVLGLIGPNGSGKTTLFNVITGVHPPDTGRVMLRGEDISGSPPARIVRHGIARTFQNLRIYKRMSVRENVWVAQHSLPGIRPADLLSNRSAAERERRAEVERLLDAVGLADRRDVLAGSLPLPDQRRLELARALVRSPTLLLLDEPAGGMTPAETAEMAALIRDFALPGRTCIVIEHKLDLISALCQRLCVLNFGRKIAEGDPQEVLQQADVLEAYLGQDAAHA